MSGQGFSEIVKRIHADEVDAVSKIEASPLELTGTPQEKFAAISQFARPFLTSGLSTFDGKADVEWGQYPYASDGSVKLPQMLLLSPAVIVDVMSHPQDDFELTFGVTPKQFKRLAKEGFVIPNLAFDSEFMDREGNLFPTRRIKDESDYEKRKYIAEILGDEEMPVNINGLRRKKLFESLGHSLKNQREKTNLFTRRLKYVFDRENEQIVNTMQSGMPTRSIGSLVEKLSHNLMYLDFFGTLFESRDDIKFVNALVNSPDRVDPRTLIELITLRKADMCAEITATFGGAQSATLSQLNRIHSARYVVGGMNGELVKNTSEDVSVQDVDVEFANFMLSLTETRRSGLIKVSNSIDMFPIRDPAIFEEFVTLLKLVRAHRQQLEQLQFTMMDCASKFELAQNMNTYVKLLNEVMIEQRNWNSVLKHVGISVVSTAAGAVVSDGVKECTHIDSMLEGVFPHAISRRMFISATGGILAGATGAGASIGTSYSLGGPIDFGRPEVFGKRKIISETAGVFLE